MPIRVLFICTGNSARSIMAEAILNKLGHDRYIAFSAGANPSGVVNPLTIEVLKAKGYETSGLFSKPLSQFLEQDFDNVITVCDNARQSCPIWPASKTADKPGKTKMFHWSIADPAAFAGAETARRQFFNDIYGDIETRIKNFIQDNP